MTLESSQSEWQSMAITAVANFKQKICRCKATLSTPNGWPRELLHFIIMSEQDVTVINVCCSND